MAAMPEQAARLADFFELRLIKVCQKVDQEMPEIECQVVMCPKILELAEHVVKVRDPAASWLTLGLDGGGSFLKVVLSVISGKLEHSGHMTQKRRPNEGSKHNEFDVKRIVIIGTVKDIPETHNNLHELLKALGLNKIDFSYAVDLKVANMLTSLQSHSFGHPCTWCEASPPFDKEGK